MKYEIIFYFSYEIIFYFFHFEAQDQWNILFLSWNRGSSIKNGTKYCNLKKSREQQQSLNLRLLKIKRKGQLRFYGKNTQNQLMSLNFWREGRQESWNHQGFLKGQSAEDHINLVTVASYLLLTARIFILFLALLLHWAMQTSAECLSWARLLLLLGMLGDQGKVLASMVW